MLILYGLACGFVTRRNDYLLWVQIVCLNVINLLLYNIFMSFSAPVVTGLMHCHLKCNQMFIYFIYTQNKRYLNLRFEIRVYKDSLFLSSRFSILISGHQR